MPNFFKFFGNQMGKYFFFLVTVAQMTPSNPKSTRYLLVSFCVDVRNCAMLEPPLTFCSETFETLESHANQFTGGSARIGWQKICNANLRVPLECPCQVLLTEPPLDMSVCTLNYFEIDFDDKSYCSCL